MSGLDAVWLFKLWSDQRVYSLWNQQYKQAGDERNVWNYRWIVKWYADEVTKIVVYIDNVNK